MDRPKSRVPTASNLTIFGSYKQVDGDPYALPPKGSLIYESPYKDGVKLQTFQGLVLHYIAVFKNPKPADAKRKFIVYYHLEDDTIEVKEPMSRTLVTLVVTSLREVELKIHRRKNSFNQKIFLSERKLTSSAQILI